jgi:predicted RND superfamily exporter protein
MHGDDPVFYRIPESRDLAAQYLLFYEMSLPFGHDLNNRIDVAKSATRVTVFLDAVSATEVRQLAECGEAWLRAHAPEMAGPATGLSVVYAYMTERNIRSMLGGTFVGLLLISVCLFLVLRSVPIGLISLAPNLIPAAMAFGLWGYISGEVNLAVSVVGSMTFGIIVDDTVHILTHYLRCRREHGMDATAAVRYSLATVGIAAVVTSAALCVGFGVLAMSGFAVSSQMGVLSMITVALALLAELLFLPPLLIQFGKHTS